LNEPETEIRLQHALVVYDTVSRVILAANDIQNTVGLLFLYS